jgi:hypothetical protein
MAYAQHRSKSEALTRGAMDGKYFYARPNTEDPEGRNSRATLADRESLNMWDGYTQQEAPRKDSPGGP